MPQEYSMQEAIKMAIQTEKNVMDFYGRAAKATKDPRGKKVFEVLCKEEREHASSFFSLYTGGDLGTFEEFIDGPPQPNSAMLRELEKCLDENVQERKAMEIALREEEDLEKSLRITAAKIVDPGVRSVFERMAKETHQHYEVIESEYAHMMAMVHETDIDTYVRE